MAPVRIDSENILLNLTFQAGPKDKNAVEIWYGNDKNR